MTDLCLGIRSRRNNDRLIRNQTDINKLKTLLKAEPVVVYFDVTFDSKRMFAYCIVVSVFSCLTAEITPIIGKYFRNQTSDLPTSFEIVAEVFI